ncbi:triose-phosphate isomerase [Pneumocystis carinii B80]|uniref:Triosephosphate isomerase n=1 Tax=Pneumocystis carinii (strain B80) TaxID=1408658 RepID=A0A0W4ZE75_PNEC8|nr:triose-phosphate isomerase [Pneumocystis carinii B80]KTW26676.1 triose-phosphate isomerase [Pneumocystis carinii B80]
MTRKFFVGGNFKANGTIESIKKIVDFLNKSELDSNVDVVISPSELYLLYVREHLRDDIGVSAQNVYSSSPGPYTGEITAEQLKDAKILWTIVGHSERRTYFNESDQFIALKTKHALENGMSVILCIGENLEERESGRTIDVVTSQLQYVFQYVKYWSNLVIAYEPVWAIGTGKAASPEQAQNVHSEIRLWLKKQLGEESDNIRIIYGGSVTSKNAKELSVMADIDGFLLGGASLKEEFKDIINIKISK